MLFERKMFCASCGAKEDVYAIERGTAYVYCEECHDLARDQTDLATVFASLDRVFFVSEKSMGALDKAFAKIARRAKRIGVDAPTYAVTGEFFEEYFYGEERPRKSAIRKLHVVVVNPNRSRIKIDGYTFVATIELGAEGNLIRAVPGEFVPKKYRACSNECEHCNKVRSRKEVFVLRGIDGNHIQIGRNCCVEFLGVDGIAYADRAEYMSTLDETLDSTFTSDDDEDISITGAPRYVRLNEYLAHCAEVMTRIGWISRAQTRENGGMATADTAAKHYFRMFSDNETPLYRSVSDESYKRAAAAISWAESIEGEDVSDYIHNLRVLAKRGYLSMRDLGIAASMIQACERASRKVDASTAKRVSEYVGTEGAKIETLVIIDKVISMDGQFGITHLHIMTDAHGNKLKYFSSSLRLDEGATVSLRGTIKKLDEYRGERQTVLTRCSIVTRRAFFSAASDTLIYAESEKEAASILREKLNVKKLSKGMTVHEFSLMSA